MFTDRTIDNSLNSTFISTLEVLNGTRNLTTQDIQTPSHLGNEKTVKTMLTITQQSISANSFTIHSKTFCYSKILTNGLSNN